MNPQALFDYGSHDPDYLYQEPLTKADDVMRRAKKTKPRYCVTCGHRLAESNPHKHCLRRSCWPKKTNTPTVRSLNRTSPKFEKNTYVGRDGDLVVKNYNQKLQLAQHLGYPDLRTAVEQHYLKTGSIRKTARALGYSFAGLKGYMARAGIKGVGA